MAAGGFSRPGFCVLIASSEHADITVLLEEPCSYDGLAGTVPVSDARYSRRSADAKQGLRRSHQ